MRVRGAMIMAGVAAAVLALGADTSAQSSDYVTLTGCSVSAVQYSYWPDGNRGDGTVANVEKLFFTLSGCSSGASPTGVTMMTGHPEVGPVRANGHYLVPAAVFNHFWATVKDAMAQRWRVSVSGENLRSYASKPYQITVEGPPAASHPPPAGPIPTAPIVPSAMPAPPPVVPPKTPGRGYGF